MSEWVVALLGLSAGMTVGTLVGLLVLKDPPASSLRTNVDGRSVPVVLGWSIGAGAVAGLLIVVAFAGDSDPWLPFRIVAPLLAISFLVGWWDDRKGDERPRGFKGHLGALRSRTLTGGLLKMVGVGIGGLITMTLLLDGLRPLEVWILGALTIALTANLINLFDRAPGRASKVFLVLAFPLFVADPDWRLVAAGCVGAVIASLPLDLGAKAMLGDAGANPMGAIGGLGLVLISDGSTPVLLVMVVVLLGLNLLSEKVSFSKVIQDRPWLARLDHLGRK